MFDFTYVRDVAQLMPNDISKLVGVNRGTASLWLNGHKQPHNLLTAKVQSVVDGITAAVDAGLLPVPPGTMRRERGFYIQQAIATATAKKQ